MADCTEFDALLAERASGDLDRAGAFRLDAHLATCARCRAELAAWERTFADARLPAVSDAERRPLAHLSTRARAELQHSPLMKALGRLLILTAVAAGFAVVFANKVILPAAERRASEPSVVAAWKEPDVDTLLQRVEKEHPELASATDNGLSPAERVADAAYLKAFQQ